MIQFDFFYREHDSHESMRRGEVTIETARPNVECWSCRVIASQPIRIDNDIYGNDSLQAVELALKFVHSLLTRNPSYEFFHWENDESTNFIHFQPMTWTNLYPHNDELIDENK